MKLTTSRPEEVTYDAESQTVSFQSSPNFQVLQGFKLLNLSRNKNKFYSKNTRRSTTEGNSKVESVEQEQFSSYSGIYDVNHQVYDNCGRTKIRTEIDRNGK